MEGKSHTNLVFKTKMQTLYTLRFLLCMYKLLLDFFYLRVKKTSKATLLNFYMANHFIYYIIFSRKSLLKIIVYIEYIN